MGPEPGAAFSESSKRTLRSGVPAGLGCVLLLTVLVVGVVCVWTVGALALERQILIHAGQPDEIRIWLVDEDGYAGVGYSLPTRAAGEAGAGEECYRTSVRFLLWRGSAADLSADYCSCYAEQGGQWIQSGECAEP